MVAGSVAHLKKTVPKIRRFDADSEQLSRFVVRSDPVDLGGVA